MGLVAYVLWRLRDTFRPGLLFALYLVLAGAERFLVEFIRRNDDVALGLTQAQLISLAMILAGGVWLRQARRDELSDRRGRTSSLAPLARSAGGLRRTARPSAAARRRSGSTSR